jgi:hypothetical protein
MDALMCQCGRPLNHTGRHIGYRNGETPMVSSRNGKLRAAVEAELKLCHALIVRLKAELRDRQALLRETEVKLAPLNALLAVYRDLALPAPALTQNSTSESAITPSPIVPASPARRFTDPFERNPHRAHEVAVDDDEANYEPVEVSFAQVVAWAAVRNLAFKTWDDLRTINARREEFELPPFKRKLGRDA